MIGFYDDIITRLTNESALRMIKMAKNLQSVEQNIADLANRWFKSYELDYKLEQESLNDEINRAVDDCFSKNGGTGGNRPDAKLLLQDRNL